MTNPASSQSVQNLKREIADLKIKRDNEMKQLKLRQQAIAAKQVELKKLTDESHNIELAVQQIDAHLNQLQREMEAMSAELTKQIKEAQKKP